MSHPPRNVEGAVRLAPQQELRSQATILDVDQTRSIAQFLDANKFSNREAVCFIKSRQFEQQETFNGDGDIHMRNYYGNLA